jgi:flagella basal body P-ring formation protein FlgA
MVLRALLCSAGLAACGAAAAVQPPGAERLRLFVEREAGMPAARVEVSIGALDPRVDLGACARLEPFVPSGTKLWGRAWIGVRCVEGPPLIAYLPVQVQVYGPALVATRALPAGSALGPQDVRLEEIELTRERPGVLADPAAVANRVLARPVAAGQALHPDFLRSPPAVSAGDSVRAIYSGKGFTVSVEGRAMASAAEGEAVRIQTATGKTLAGIARAGRVVEIAR